MNDSASIGVVIPTLNAERQLEPILRHVLDSVDRDHLVVVDSSSEDGTLEICRRWGVRVEVIDRSSFNHGGTRNLARSLLKVDFIVYMTQDAVPTGPESVPKLCASLTDPSVGAAYGRQLPRPNCSPLEAFPRLFNYPDASVLKERGDIPKLGVKAFFCSNSFCGYRVDALDSVGGFPERVIGWEDQHIGARLLLGGFKIAYVAEATVFHSHRYTVFEEFQRYFDAGAFMKEESWMKDLAGRAEGEGMRFLKEQTSYLATTGRALLIPYSLLLTAVKYAGYRCGQAAPLLPVGLTRRLSRQPYYW